MDSFHKNIYYIAFLSFMYKFHEVLTVNHYFKGFTPIYFKGTLTTRKFNTLDACYANYF